MSRSDRRHALAVLESLSTEGPERPALTQAALLHDCAKQLGPLRLWHRVAMVLVGALNLRWLERFATEEPSDRNWRHPFWEYVNHPHLGASAAETAGCDSLAVRLIRRHQEPRAGKPTESIEDRLLAELQTADDHN